MEPVDLLGGGGGDDDAPPTRTQQPTDPRIVQDDDESEDGEYEAASESSDSPSEGGSSEDDDDDDDDADSDDADAGSDDQDDEDADQDDDEEEGVGAESQGTSRETSDAVAVVDASSGAAQRGAKREPDAETAGGGGDGGSEEADRPAKKSRRRAGGILPEEMDAIESARQYILTSNRIDARKDADRTLSDAKAACLDACVRIVATCAADSPDYTRLRKWLAEDGNADRLSLRDGMQDTDVPEWRSGGEGDGGSSDDNDGGCGSAPSTRGEARRAPACDPLSVLKKMAVEYNASARAAARDEADAYGVDCDSAYDRAVEQAVTSLGDEERALLATPGPGARRGGGGGGVSDEERKPWDYDLVATAAAADAASAAVTATSSGGGSSAESPGITTRRPRRAASERARKRVAIQERILSQADAAIDGGGGGGGGGGCSGSGNKAIAPSGDQLVQAAVVFQMLRNMLAIGKMQLAELRLAAAASAAKPRHRKRAVEDMGVANRQCMDVFDRFTACADDATQCFASLLGTEHAFIGMLTLALGQDTKVRGTPSVGNPECQFTGDLLKEPGPSGMQSSAKYTLTLSTIGYGGGGGGGGGAEDTTDGGGGGSAADTVLGVYTVSRSIFALVRSLNRLHGLAGDSLICDKFMQWCVADGPTGEPEFERVCTLMANAATNAASAGGGGDEGKGDCDQRLTLLDACYGCIDAYFARSPRKPLDGFFKVVGKANTLYADISEGGGFFTGVCKAIVAHDASTGV